MPIRIAYTFKIIFMGNDKHMVGFEKEERFNNAFSFLLEQCPKVQKVKVLYQLLNKVDSIICAGLFDRRRCKRRLIYTGDAHDFFKNGNVYDSIDFNGGTYTIVGYDRLIGCAYFEIVCNSI